MNFTVTGTAVIDTTTPDPSLADVELDGPVPPREARYGHATDAELRLAAAAGVAAFNADRPRAPGTDATVRDLIDAHNVGQPRTIQIMRAWVDAYEAECDAAADAILANA